MLVFFSPRNPQTIRLFGLAFVFMALFSCDAASALCVVRETIPAIGPTEYVATRSDYPLMSLLFEEEGRVVIKLKIDKKGIMKESRIETSSGFKRLDQRSLWIVRNFKYKPAKYCKKPVTDYVYVEVRWSLKKEDSSASKDESASLNERQLDRDCKSVRLV